MAIEITSIAGPRQTRSPGKFKRTVPRAHANQPISRRRLILRSLAALFVIALIAGSDALLSSYKYYSRM
ncbi:MAG TPA: hypothetical protein VE977_06355, partial [Pyrinomonadaceae bacterium]|nr:hypothetical protein [Pyrinomonadaceae bacterium]